jgi:hypothetical protein
MLDDMFELYEGVKAQLKVDFIDEIKFLRFNRLLLPKKPIPKNLPKNEGITTELLDF